jgi:predicted permease
LVRQFLTESLMLAVMGGGLGLAVITGGLDALVALAPADIPLLDDTRIDPVVMGFAATATLLATLLFGLLPALRVTAVDLGASLRSSHERAGGLRHAKLRSGLLIAEVALSVVLLVGAGLLVRSFMRLQALDLGFRAENLLTMSIDVPRSRYSGTQQHVDFYNQLLERAEALPGVISVAGTAEPPLMGYNMTFSFAIEGRPSGDPDGREDPVSLRSMTPGFFRTMGIPLLSGRVIDTGDRAGAPAVIVINEALARRHWPGENPVGQRISFVGPEGPDWWEIIGVVGATRHSGADRPADPALYIAHAQKTWDWMSWMTIVARTDGAPLALAPAFREALRQIDDRLPIERLSTMNELYADSNARRRFAATLFGGFAALALVLGVIGIYGVLSYSVARRTRDIGVRIALGARRSSVAAAVVRQGLTLAVAGVVIGLAAAYVLTRFLESLVFGITTTDTVTFVAVPILLTAVAALAAYLPARRATRVDPVQALRAE